MKYLNPDGFSVAATPTQQYRDNWEVTFGEKPTAAQVIRCDCPSRPGTSDVVHKDGCHNDGECKHCGRTFDCFGVCPDL